MEPKAECRICGAERFVSELDPNNLCRACSIIHNEDEPSVFDSVSTHTVPSLNDYISYGGKIYTIDSIQVSTNDDSAYSRLNLNLHAVIPGKLESTVKS